MSRGMSQPAPMDVSGDETTIKCPCGEEHWFESADGEPNEQMQPIKCDCGRTIRVVAVSWYALVEAEVDNPKPNEGEVHEERPAPERDDG